MLKRARSQTILLFCQKLQKSRTQKQRKFLLEPPKNEWKVNCLCLFLSLTEKLLKSYLNLSCVKRRQGHKKILLFFPSKSPKESNSKIDTDNLLFIHSFLGSNQSLFCSKWEYFVLFASFKIRKKFVSKRDLDFRNALYPMCPV